MNNNNETPVIDAIADAYNTRRKIDLSIAMAQLYVVGILTFVLLVVVCALVYTGKIEGSSATGIFGAIVGYVFGMRVYHTPPTYNDDVHPNTEQK